MNWTEYEYIAKLIEAMKKVKVESPPKPDSKPQSK